jgi:hypothetical protein
MPSRREGGEGIQLSDAWHVFSIREEEPMILIPVYPSGRVLSDSWSENDRRRKGKRTLQ